MNLISEHNPILRKPTSLIEDGKFSSLSSIIQQMYDIMYEFDGVGLAAPQIGLDLNLFVMEWDNIKRACINSVILETSTEIVDAAEGCLSFPNLKLNIKRPKWVKVGWLDENGTAYTATLHDMEARIFLHEWDHCQGILFTDRVGKITLHMARAKAQKIARRIK